MNDKTSIFKISIGLDSKINTKKKLSNSISSIVSIVETMARIAKNAPKFFKESVNSGLSMTYIKPPKYA